MHIGTIAFLIGILMFSRLVELPPFHLLYLFPVSVAFVIFNGSLRLIALVCCGFLWAMLRAELILSDHLYKAQEKKTFIATGQIVSLPEVRERSVRFQFYIKSMKSENGQSWPTPGKVRLNWYHPNSTVRPGQNWKLSVRLKRPHGFSNPGGFDYESWLFQKRVRSTGYVINNSGNTLLKLPENQFIDKIRYQLLNRINQSIDDESFKGLVIALGLGTRSQISQLSQQILFNTGTSHLLAISGLHIGMISGLAFFLARRLWSYSSYFSLNFASPRFGAIAAFFAAILYAALAGFSIPTQRALIIVVVMMYSIFSNKRYAVSQIIMSSLFFILIFDPFAVLSAGFWLSFGAVFIILYGMSCRIGCDNFWWRWAECNTF